MTSNITIFKNIRETQTPFYRNITEILQRIKDGASKNLVKEIRSEKDKTTRNDLKKSLLYLLIYHPLENIIFWCLVYKVVQTV